jgi:uncharacterized membrane protein YbaN (DUF454 family)
MDQKPSVANWPGSINIERLGDMVRLSWNHRDSIPRSMTFKATLVTQLMLLSFGWFLAKSPYVQVGLLVGALQMRSAAIH